MSKQKTGEPVRLQLYLSQCGLGSRRQCEQFILDGLVDLNGERVTRLGVRVESDDDVRYRGRKVFPTKKHIYLALHKPQGYICSSEDRSGRPLIYDLVKTVVPQRVFTIGRLDYMSSGLILLTNDGDFAQKIIHPASRIEKEYLVTTSDEIPVELMEAFRKGLRIDGEIFRLKEYRLQGSRKVSIVLEEGKNREIRKVFLSRNLKIKKIHRVRIARLSLGNLPSGHFRHLKEAEVQMLLKAADIPQKAGKGDHR